MDHLLILTGLGLVALWIVVPIPDLAFKVLAVAFLGAVWAGVVTIGLQILAALGLYTGSIRLK